jgi:5-(carboxyamino)imidazole ribonucleotide synthase
VSKDFPTVGFIGTGEQARMYIAPAISLGIDLVLWAVNTDTLGIQAVSHYVGDCTDLDAVREFAKKCDVVTFEHDLLPMSAIKTLEVEGVKFRPSSKSLSDSSIYGGTDLNEPINSEVTVLVARSPHGQATSWAPAEKIYKDGNFVMTISPAPTLNAALSEQAQRISLEIAAQVNAIGVIAVDIQMKNEQLFFKKLTMYPQETGNWTIEGSRTSQFEQHLRAILDLPLGDPAMTAQFVVTGNVVCGQKADMYRPYLHLMARTPGLKFHQNLVEATPGAVVGHISLLGDDLNELIDEVLHALDYLSAEIDE